MKRIWITCLMATLFVLESCGGSSSRTPLSTGTTKLTTSTSTTVTKDHDYQGTLGNILVIRLSTSSVKPSSKAS
jgi:hypothetical protein